MDLLAINIVIGGLFGTIGGGFGIFMTARTLKKQRAEDRAAFLAAQKKQMEETATGVVKEVKDEIGKRFDSVEKKFDNVENVLKTRGEILTSIQKSVERLQEDVDEIEKKLIALDTAAKLKLPEIDKIKDDINALKDKLQALQLANGK